MGFYTPATSDWRRQLEGYDDEDAQFLIELYSGHGNAEEYRSWNDVLADDQGVLYCPETSDDFLPTCQQAGNIMAERCSNAGFDKNYCDDLVEKTKMYSANMGAGSFAAVNETDEDEFLDAGQCRDCFQPAFNYRPLGSAQYILAMTDFTNPEYPKDLNLVLLDQVITMLQDLALALKKLSGIPIQKHEASLVVLQKA
ncbi:MAG: hypothetical protein CM15mP127_01890 [Gammaproteobacteria bacterium]|nr:MAG: hypothetical protein CM15mP127_01890 [Gammaproteobacteria bacterium]